MRNLKLRIVLETVQNDVEDEAFFVMVALTILLAEVGEQRNQILLLYVRAEIIVGHISNVEQQVL